MDWHNIPVGVRSAARSAAALLARSSIEDVVKTGHFPSSDLRLLHDTIDMFRPFTGLASDDAVAFADCVAVELSGQWHLEVPIFAKGTQTDLYLYVTINRDTFAATMTDVVVP